VLGLVEDVEDPVGGLTAGVVAPDVVAAGGLVAGIFTAALAEGMGVAATEVDVSGLAGGGVGFVSPAPELELETG
jgi:hypothetical protein